eukprot:6878261-Prymnesium_polylepis.1
MRQALLRAVYAALFGWLVLQINGTLSGGAQPRGDQSAHAMLSPAPHRLGGGGGGGGKGGRYFVGILDVFGFEVQRTNSLEQLLINFTSEKLQA